MNSYKQKIAEKLCKRRSYKHAHYSPARPQMMVNESGWTIGMTEPEENLDGSKTRLEVDAWKAACNFEPTEPEFPEASQCSSDKPINSFKMIIVGEPMVGKSSVGLRLAGRFYIFTHRTCGPNYFTQTMCMDDSVAKFAVWETAFVEQCRNLQPHAAVIVYDITDRKSFEKIPSWVRSLQKNISKDIVIAIAGNKLDLEETREVPAEEAQKLASEFDLVFLEVSAMNGISVDELFLLTAKRIRAVSEGTHKTCSEPIYTNKLKQKEGRSRKASCTVS